MEGICDKIKRVYVNVQLQGMKQTGHKKANVKRDVHASTEQNQKAKHKLMYLTKDKALL